MSLWLIENNEGWTYEQVRTLYKEKNNCHSYSTEIRPVVNQSSIINVTVYFEIMSIVEVNDVLQSITLNGFVNLNWRDEMLEWNPSDYGHITRINPKVTDIWKRRVMLINTPKERDPLRDDNAPLFLYSNGEVAWSPGGIISFSCSLDMTYFPFDKQECSLYFYSMNHDVMEIDFQPSKRTPFPHLNVTAEWKLVEAYADPEKEEDSNGHFPSIHYLLVLKGRPTSFMITVMMPACFLSLLNFFVFVIPVNSGEKVSYGITVLLAQSVYMTTLTNLLPRSSGNLPRVTIYVFCLLVISAFNVLISIATLFVHKLETKQHTASRFGKLRAIEDASVDELVDNQSMNRRLHQFQSAFMGDRLQEAIMKAKKSEAWKAVALKWINSTCFTVSCLWWITVNIWFFLSTLLS